MPKAFAVFDTIQIINLPERSDRRAEMAVELDRLGLSDDPRVSFFAAIRPDNAGTFTSIGARGVYESQKAILNEAARHERSVLILEDDCAFAEGARTADFGGDWDVFYGGYYASDPADLVRSDIVGAHMMGFSAAGARRAAQFLNTLQAEGIHPPIDAAYVWWRRADTSVKAAFAIPPLANQRFSRSDIAPVKLHDRLQGLRQLVSAFRRIRNQKGRP